MCLFSCSPSGSVGIPLSMMKMIPNSLSRSSRRSMSLTLHIGMTSLSLVRSYCSFNCNNYACMPACSRCPSLGVRMHPPFNWKPLGMCIYFSSNSYRRLFLQESKLSTSLSSHTALKHSWDRRRKQQKTVPGRQSSLTSSYPNKIQMFYVSLIIRREFSCVTKTVLQVQSESAVYTAKTNPRN